PCAGRPAGARQGLQRHIAGMGMSRGKDAIRQSVLGADRAFKVVDGGKGPPPGPPGPKGGDSDDDDPCPVTALGHTAGTYYFLDPIGQERSFTARQIGSRADVVGLFHGNDDWLRRQFPVSKDVPDAHGGKVSVVVDFRVNSAAKFLISLASAKGLIGSR